MSKQQNKDLCFGNRQEINCQPLIEKITGKLNKTAPFHSYDYYNDTYFVELKSRRCYKNTYPTTMVGYNKIKKATDNSKTYLFCFKFYDGLFYHIYNPEVTYEIKKGGRTDRNCIEISDYLFIPVKDLIAI
jgi:hypothetical protein